MITEDFVLVERAAEKAGIDPDKMQAVSTVMFQALAKWSANPTSLRCTLSGIGTFFIRKIKVTQSLKRMKAGTNHIGSENSNFLKMETLKNIAEMYERYVDELKQEKIERHGGKIAYENYILAKKQEQIQRTKRSKPPEYKKYGRLRNPALDGDDEDFQAGRPHSGTGAVENPNGK